MALPGHKYHFVLAEFENLVSSFRDSPLAARILPWRPPLLPGSPFFLLPRARLSTRALLSLLPSSLCIPWGITRPNVHHVSSLSPTRGIDSLPLSRQSFHGFLRRRGWASELVQIPMRRREQRKPITDSSCAIS